MFSTVQRGVGLCWLEGGARPARTITQLRPGSPATGTFFGLLADSPSPPDCLQRGRGAGMRCWLTAPRDDRWPTLRAEEHLAENATRASDLLQSENALGLSSLRLTRRVEKYTGCPKSISFLTPVDKLFIAFIAVCNQMVAKWSLWINRFSKPGRGWLFPIIPALQRLRQEHCFEVEVVSKVN